MGRQAARQAGSKLADTLGRDAMCNFRHVESAAVLGSWGAGSRDEQVGHAAFTRPAGGQAACELVVIHEPAPRAKQSGIDLWSKAGQIPIEPHALHQSRCIQAFKCRAVSGRAAAEGLPCAFGMQGAPTLRSQVAQVLAGTRTAPLLGQRACRGQVRQAGAPFLVKERKEAPEGGRQDGCWMASARGRRPTGLGREAEALCWPGAVTEARQWLCRKIRCA